MKHNKVVNYAHQGDLNFRKIDKLPKGLQPLAYDKSRGGFTLALGEHTPIPNWEGYFATQDGKIWSRVEQTSPKGIQGFVTKKNSSFKELSGTVTKFGYLQVGLRKGNKGYSQRVNRLIALTFLQNPESYKEVRHLDGDKLNNRVNNLAWGNAKMNAVDRENHGHTSKGVDRPDAKLDAIKVLTILKLKEKGLSLQTIATKFKVSKKLILLVCQKKLWKHISENYSLVPWDSHAGGYTLAVGEHTSHKHTLIVDEEAEFVKVLRAANGMQYLVVTKEVELKHGTFIAPAKIDERETDKHASIIFTPGIYEQRVEEEYDPFAQRVREVQD